MKFFTPKLFLQFNSADDEVADRADADWEAAIREYRSHLEGLRDQMPAQVQSLAALVLHDAELLALEQPFVPLTPFPAGLFPLWSGFAILSVKHEEGIVSLIYLLWDRLRSHQAEEPWPFSSLRPHWLYDEIDVTPDQPGMFLHRVLLSDGTVMEIPFVSALIHSIPLQDMPQGGGSRQIA